MANVKLDSLINYMNDQKEQVAYNRNWIYPNKLEDKEMLEFRVLDPLPNLNGRYFMEVIIWFINSKRIISPSTFGEPDIVEQIVRAAKNSNDEEIKQLIFGNSRYGGKVQKVFENWIPVLVFDFVVKNNQIDGIYDSHGNIDPELVAKYIRDGIPKILVAKTSILSFINKYATSRNGLDMFEPDKGFNLVLIKEGKGKQTRYTVQKSDVMPVPTRYYAEDVVPDVYNLAKAGVRTDEYIESVINNFLYGDPIMEDTENTYRYPEIRNMIKQAASINPPKEKPRITNLIKTPRVVEDNPVVTDQTTNTGITEAKSDSSSRRGRPPKIENTVSQPVQTRPISRNIIDSLSDE